MASYLSPTNSFQVIRGSSLVIDLEVLTAEGTPYDLTGGVVWFTVKSSLDSDTVLIQKRSDVGTEAQITDSRGGMVEVYLQPEDTQDLGVGKYAYDIWLVQGTDRKVLVSPSEMEIKAAVTRLG